MRLIGSLTDKQQAENFSAYLLTEGVNAHLEQEGGEIEIWIKDEDFVSQAVAEFDAFRQSPTESKYVEAGPRAKEIQLQKLKKQKRIAKNIVDVRSAGGVGRNHRLTVFLIVICGVVALLTQFGGPQSVTKATYRALSFNAIPEPAASQILDASSGDRDALDVRLASVKRGEVWRLITPIFLHFGVFHLVFNMYWLFILGGQIENRYGSMWYGILILVAAICSNFVQCTVPLEVGGSAPSNLGGYLINQLGGMSGVVYALFGFVVMRMTYDRSSGLFLPQSTVILLLVWLVFCMTPIASDVFHLRVANWAHAIGLLVGLIAGYWPMMIPTRSVGM